MKITVKNNQKRPKKRMRSLLTSHGTSADKKAYRSLTKNLVGLTRKVQSTEHKLANANNHIESLNAELAEVRKIMLYQADGLGKTTLGVGDGTGSKFVYGDYDSIKAAQDQILGYSDVRIACANMANHIESSKGALPAEWYEWANEIAHELRELSK